MSAKVPRDLPMRELMKHTGYECETNERACCCLSGKLRAWVKASTGEIIYTHVDIPYVGEWYYSGTSDLGKIQRWNIPNTATVTAEKIEFTRESVYARTPEEDLEI